MIVITVARKPLSEPNVALNVLVHGTGAINVDACRVGTNGEKLSCSRADPYHATDGSQRTWNPTSTKGIERQQHAGGRWPANTILQHLPGCLDASMGCVKDCPVQGLDNQSGFLHPSGNKKKDDSNAAYQASSYHISYKGRALRDIQDAGGGASRFFKQIHS